MDRYVEAYGGYLEKEKMEMDNFGNMKIRFNRDIVYDELTVKEYIPDYEYEKITLMPSEEELQEFKD